MLRHPDFTLYALNDKTIAEHKSVHRGNKKVKGRLKKDGWFAEFLHYKNLQFLRHLVHLLFKEECPKIFKVIKQVQKLQKQLEIEKGQNTLKHK